jgi:hypothetical protein
MKKLLAILVITLLAIPMFAGTDILNFMWFNNKVAGSMSDVYNPMSNAGDEGQAGVDQESTANDDDAVVRQWNYYGFLEQFMCGMWGTAFEGDNIALKMDFFNYTALEMADWGFNNVMTITEQIRFKGIMEVAGIYTLAIGAADIWQFRPFSNLSTDTSVSGTVNTQYANNIVYADETAHADGQQDINGDGDDTDTNVPVYDEDSDGAWTNVAGGVEDTYAGEGDLSLSGSSGTDNFIQIRQHRIHLIFENSIKVLEYLNIGLNFYAEFAQIANAGFMTWSDGAQGSGAYTNLDLDFVLALSGSYSFGFSWGLSQEIKVGLQLENYKDNDPAVDGCIIDNRHSTNAFRKVPLFQTNLNVSQEVLGLAGIENVTLTISLASLLQIHKPWSGGLEENTIIESQSKIGLQVGFYGFYVGLFMLMATQDTVNTDRAFNDSKGSNYNCTDTDYSNYYAQSGNDGTGGRPHGRGQMGFQLTAGYSRGFFGFDFSYIGQGQIRDYDVARDNYAAILSGDEVAYDGVDNGGLFRNFASYHRWMNQIDVAINFSW